MSRVQCELSGLLNVHLPVFLEALHRHQYKEAKTSIPLESNGVPEWKAMATMLQLWADCDCTYHKMTYLQAEHLSKNTLRSLYLRLKMQSDDCADILHFQHREKAGSESDVDKIMRQTNTPPIAPSGYYDALRLSWQSDQSVKDNQSSVDSIASNVSEFDMNVETTLTTRVSEYKAFFDQCSRYFEQRLLLVSFYLGLAREKPHIHYLFDYAEKAQRLLEIQHALRTLEHPLFHSIQKAAMHETQTIRAALNCESKLAEYDYLKSIIALHQLKQQLGLWADSLDISDDDESPETSGNRQSRTSRDSDRPPPTPNTNEKLPSHLSKPHGLPIPKMLLKRGESSSNMLLPSTHSLSNSNLQNCTQPAPDDDVILPLYRWSKKFFVSLTAKFTLYFSKWLDHFDTQMPPRTLPAPRSIVSPMGLPYTEILDTFFARNFLRDHNDTAQMMIVLDTQSLSNKGVTFHANGYLCPPKATVVKTSSKTPNSNRIRAANKTYFGRVSRYDEDIHGEFAPLWGVGSWPVGLYLILFLGGNILLVFSYPRPEPSTLFVQKHWPNLLMLLMDLPPWDVKASTIYTSPISIHHEKKMAASYVIARIDPCIYLTLVYEKRKQGPNEKQLMDVMTLLLDNLQHITVYR
ncbi:hypothetical protein THRCLA_01302 [Thraustotheca clavata]|uniref:Uncharacterized protein n=1 Tax=Thraustotheca clavata TaxID=74557 RepID=A0A1W0A8Z1_9STRA|nr:hypothetical protein THRCLA_01302 [Thraustotheca clavata]